MLVLLIVAAASEIRRAAQGVSALRNEMSSQQRAVAAAEAEQAEVSRGVNESRRGRVLARCACVFDVMDDAGGEADGVRSFFTIAADDEAAVAVVEADAVAEADTVRQSRNPHSPSRARRHLPATHRRRHLATLNSPSGGSRATCHRRRHRARYGTSRSPGNTARAVARAAGGQGARRGRMAATGWMGCLSHLLQQGRVMRRTSRSHSIVVTTFMDFAELLSSPVPTKQGVACTLDQ